MPTVLRLGNVRVVIYSNDLRLRAKFNLNCPNGPVELVEQEGFKLTENRYGGRGKPGCHLYEVE